MDVKEKAQALENTINELKGKVDGIENLEVKTKLEGFQATLNELKTKMDGLDEKDYSKDLQDLNSAVNKLDEKMKGMNVQAEEKQVTLGMALKAMTESEDFINAKKSGFTAGKRTFELKVNTGNITGTVGRSQIDPRINILPNRQLAFLPYGTQINLEQDRSRILWTEAAYTSNVGYVGEGTAQATADTATAAEKGRNMAKISAKLILTAEMLEDVSLLEAEFRNQLQEKALVYADGQMYNGDGSDGGEPNHIYGLLGHATEFTLANSGQALNSTVANANIGDLIDAIVTQAEIANETGLNRVWMNPADFYKLRTAKTTTGERIFVQDVNGVYRIAGMEVVRTNAVTANTLLVADDTKYNIYMKRALEVKFGQANGTDFEKDQYTAVAFARMQLVVREHDKPAVIKVSNVATALTNLTA